MAKNVTESKIELNESFIIDGYEAYLKEVNQLYTRYRSEFERLMTYFGCDKEKSLSWAWVVVKMMRTKSKRKYIRIRFQNKFRANKFKADVWNQYNNI